MMPSEQTPLNSQDVANTVNQLIDLVSRENSFLRDGHRDGSELEQLVAEKLKLANHYYALCKQLNQLPAGHETRQELEQADVADRLHDLTVYLNENRRLLTARHSSASARVAAIMEAINDRQERHSPYGAGAQPAAANQASHLSLVTGATA